MGRPVMQPRWGWPALTRARGEREKEKEAARLTAELGTLRGWADQAQTWITGAEREIAGLRADLQVAEDDRAYAHAELEHAAIAHAELERVGGNWMAGRTRAAALMRVLLGPRYGHIAAHAPDLLTDERDPALGWQVSDRHARVAAHECGFVADEFPALLDRLSGDPSGRYALMWADLWSPSESAWEADADTWIADLLDLRTGEVVECNDATAVMAGWPDLAALHRRPDERDGPPPPGDMTLAEVRVALGLFADRTDAWTCLAVDPGTAVGRYSLYLEGHGSNEDDARGYDFPCVSLDECQAVLIGGPTEWKAQWQRAQERIQEWEQRRDAWKRDAGARRRRAPPGVGAVLCAL